MARRDGFAAGAGPRTAFVTPARRSTSAALASSGSSWYRSPVRDRQRRSCSGHALLHRGEHALLRQLLVEPLHELREPPGTEAGMFHRSAACGSTSQRATTRSRGDVTRCLVVDRACGAAADDEHRGETGDDGPPASTPACSPLLDRADQVGDAETRDAAVAARAARVEDVGPSRRGPWRAEVAPPLGCRPTSRPQYGLCVTSWCQFRERPDLAVSGWWAAAGP